MCTGVIVGLPGLIVKDDFLPLELGNLDMVLGMQWLLARSDDSGLERFSNDVHRRVY